MPPRDGAPPPGDAVVGARDAPSPPRDAPGFDFAQCPTGYVQLVGTTSRYRMNINGEPAWVHAADCANDLANATHLVAIDDFAELALVQGFLDLYPFGFAGNTTWIGAAQTRDRPTDDAWLAPNGSSLFSGWNGNEPNDGGTADQNHENFATLVKSETGMFDYRGDNRFAAVCECDGVAQAAGFTSLVTANTF